MAKKKTISFFIMHHTNKTCTTYFKRQIVSLYQVIKKKKTFRSRNEIFVFIPNVISISFCNWWSKTIVFQNTLCKFHVQELLRRFLFTFWVYVCLTPVLLSTMIILQAITKHKLWYHIIRTIHFPYSLAKMHLKSLHINLDSVLRVDFPTCPGRA